MAALLRLPGGPDDVAELVEALLVAADARPGTPTAARWRRLADQFGDALDHLPTPAPTTIKEQQQ
ncbi:acyl-CoA carboxylase subunit epsilon [Streptomyces sp. NPDC059255]|uniref:acyl-CoA carboxylase subunit epsilon n=1 Tax=Streptomyces sp. NPDC059255 TaxID=3346793 RepID=UPI00368E97E5